MPEGLRASENPAPRLSNAARWWHFDPQIPGDSPAANRTPRLRRQRSRSDASRAFSCLFPGFSPRSLTALCPILHQVVHMHVRELEHVVRGQFVVRTVFPKVVGAEGVDHLHSDGCGHREIFNLMKFQNGAANEGQSSGMVNPKAQVRNCSASALP
jgi:hypothetical protein